jgi:hypothetical protein
MNRQQAFYHRRKQSGLCPRCGRTRDDDCVECSRCRPRTRKSAATRARLRERNAAAGLCSNSCIAPIFGRSKYCARHFVYGVAHRYGFDLKDVDALLQKLAAQGYRCYYSSRELIPGVNASLDHRVPISRGGAPDSWLNVVWCDTHVNRAKGALTEQEFRDLCSSVAAQEEKPLHERYLTAFAEIHSPPTALEPFRPFARKAARVRP